MGKSIPVLLLLVIGFRLECVMIDVLHTVDQGIASHIIANVLWLVAVKKKAFGGSNQDNNIANLYAHMKNGTSLARSPSCKGS